jgi:glycosyltransferase involved in cell wall biosynthesis
MVESVACVVGSAPGIGGLGLQGKSALEGLAAQWPTVYVLGPGTESSGEVSKNIVPIPAPVLLPQWMLRWTPLRGWTGISRFLHDRALGRWAAARLRSLRPAACYLFTQVALESLRWARRRGIPTVLDSPNGHIRSFRNVYVGQARDLCGAVYRGHPSEAMVRRVEQEYTLADRIRVSSQWASASLARGGVRPEKIDVVCQPIDLQRFQPSRARAAAEGPLRVCFVGSCDLRKGFVHLLRAVRMAGKERYALWFVGATVDRCTRRLLCVEAAGLQIRHAPGDPTPAFRWAEVFVLPSLEDGFGFVIAEAMACGLPVIVSDQCGAAELVRPGGNGWVFCAGDVAALASALDEALRQRDKLPKMGAAARATVEGFATMSNWDYFREVFTGSISAAS